MKILLVDDDEMLLCVTERMLEILGYDVIVEQNSKKALDLFKQNPFDFDLIFTDQSMPKFNGIDLISEVYKISNVMLFVLCSGHDSELLELCLKSLDQNIFVEILEKPYTLDSLNYVIKKSILRNKWMIKENFLSNNMNIEKI